MCVCTCRSYPKPTSYIGWLFSRNFYFGRLCVNSLLPVMSKETLPYSGLVCGLGPSHLVLWALPFTPCINREKT